MLAAALEEARRASAAYAEARAMTTRTASVAARTALSTRRTALVERLDAVQVTRTLGAPL